MLRRVFTCSGIRLIPSTLSSRRIKKYLLMAFCLVSFSTTVSGQNVEFTNKAVDLGMRSTQRVNPITRAVEFEIPLGHYRGRGGLDVPIALSYSSKVWGIDFQGFNPGAPPPHGGIQPFTIVVAEYAKHSVAGWTTTTRTPILDFQPQNRIYNPDGSPNVTGNCTNGCFKVDRIMVWMPDGSGHEMRASDQPRPIAQAEPDDFYSVDGSRMRYQKSSNTLFLADGSHFLLGTGKFVDRNGNILNWSTGRDTLDRQINNPLPFGYGTTPASPVDQVYTMPGVGNTTITYTLKWKRLQDVLTVNPQQLRFIANTACPPETGGSFSPSLFGWDSANRTCFGNAGVLFNPVVLHQIVLPNQQAYTFTYDIFGAIDKVVLPTGGYEKFEYAQTSPISSPLNFKFVYAQANRGVTRHVVSPSGLGSDEREWLYSSTSNSVTVTAPDNSRTEQNLWTDGVSGWGYSVDSSRSGLAFEQRIYSASGQMIRRKLIDWTMTGSNATGNLTGTLIANRNARIVREVEFILDTTGPALAKSRTFSYDTTFQFNVGAEQTVIREFDYVEVDQNTAQTIQVGSVGSLFDVTLLRTIETDYLTGDANYRSRNLLALPSAVRIKNGAGVVVAETINVYDETAFPLLTYPSVVGWTDPATNVRGNVTTMRKWLNFDGTTLSAYPAGTYLETHKQYDQCGSVRKSWDARDTSKTNPTLFDYADTYHRAYVTTTTSSDPDDAGSLAPLVTQKEYDLSTGLITATIDANSQRTEFFYNEPLNRLKQTIMSATDTSAKTQTTYTYDDIGRTLTATSDLHTFNDNVLKTVTSFDGLGRLEETQQYEGLTNYVSVQHEYDVMGRRFRTSNPFRPLQGESLIWTTRSFDALGRVLSVTTPDNAVAATVYNGNRTTVTDQAGKKRTTLTDGLGRLHKVFEAPDVVGHNFETRYDYDALDNLLTITQDTQVRSFMYDSLKRLIRSRSPEQGTFNGLTLAGSNWSTGIKYDNNGNVTQKTDARGVVCTYSYDKLNRVTSIDHSDTASINPDISRFYDGAVNGKGRLWFSYRGGNEDLGANVEKTIFDSYDALGRPLVLKQRFKLNNVWSPLYRVARAYNRAGGVILQTYPSDRVVIYNYDNAGRVADKDPQNVAMAGTLGDGTPRTYSREITYAPAGQLRQEQFGTDTPVYHKLFYNSRQQLAEILTSSTTGDNWNRGKILNDYSLQCSGAGCNATDNNGNLRKQQVFIPHNDQITASTSWHQQYDYDALNRLLRVHEFTGNLPLDWQQEYVIDRWGNRTIHQTNTFGTGIAKPNFGVNTTKNQLTPPIGASMLYDNAGNLTTDSYTGAGDRIYDADNRLIQAWGGAGQWQFYTYNADGQRTRRKINGQETWHIYGFEGELVAEYAANASVTTPQKEYGYRNGKLLITAEPLGNPALPVFADDFNDNSLDASKWTVQYPGGTPPVTEESQQLKITLAPNTAAYNGVFSNSLYDLTGRMLQVEVAQAVSQAGWCENLLQLELNANNNFLIDVGVGNLLMRARVNGVNDQTSIAYDSVAHRHWRIRHDPSANTINFETSSDGTIWIVRKTVTPGFSLTSLRIHLSAGAWGTGNSSPGAAKYDNVKLLSSMASSSITVPNSGFETPSLGFGNFQYGPTGGSWNFINGGGISAGGSGFTGGPFIPQGSQVAFVQSNGEFSQSISGFQANTNYLITFLAAQRTNCCNAGGQQIAVYLDGTLLGTFNPPVNGVYTEYSTPSFTTTAGAHTVKFIGLNPGGQTAFIDHVRITGSAVVGNGVQWLVSDHLGSPRMVFDQSGSLSGVKRHDYLPFGEELQGGTNANPSPGNRKPSLGYGCESSNPNCGPDRVRQQFASKERDTETGLDYLGARYFSSAQGRFTSVDPLMFSMDLTNPQTWNRYVYAINNPLVYVDKNGKWPTRIHNQIVDYALPRLSAEQRKQIKEGSWSVDNPKNGGQDTAKSNEHGMRIPGQSYEEAASNADTFINNNVDKAKYAYAHTGLTSSLWDFGRAFHTVSDMTSPMHEGYQTWNVSDTASHIWGESSADHYRMGLAIGATLALYRYTYGQEELDKATGYTPGSVNDPYIKQLQASRMSPNKQAEAEYSYRLGLERGLKFDWGNQNGSRK